MPLSMIRKVRNIVVELDDLKKDLLGVFVFKGFSMVLNFAIIAIVLNIISPGEYGVWLTISSIISWLSFMDFGLANGLKNKLVKLFLHRKYKLIRVYISSSIFTMSVIGIAIVALAMCISLNVDLSKVLNTTVPQKTLLGIVFFSVLFFIAKAVSDLIQTFKIAEQSVSYVTHISFISNFALFLIVLAVNVFDKTIGLFAFAFIFSFVPFFISAFYSIRLLQTRYRHLQPSYKYINLGLTKDVYKLSMAFFLIQFAGIIIFSTDNVIIASIFSPGEVTKYNIAYRLFGIVPMIVSVVLTPYWPAIAKAYNLENLAWIKRKMNRLVLLWFVLCLLAGGVLFFADKLYFLWLNKDLNIAFAMSFGMFVYAMIASWNMIFAMFINSIGKIRLQLIGSLLAGALNIPLSIYLAKQFGPQGVIWATIICLSFSAVWSPIQYYKLVSRKARGIWNV